MMPAIPESEDNAPDEADNTPAKTIYRPDVARKIKANVRRVWERVKKNKGLTQANLAKAVGTTQGAVSKLINNDDGHPWTETHLKRFSDFCGVSLKELLDDDGELLGFFNSWDIASSEPDLDFVEECIGALSKYYASKGLPARRDKFTSLAAKLASRLEGTKPSAETMEKEVERVILENAAEL